MDSENFVPRPLSTATAPPINRLSNLRSTITKRIQIRRSAVRTCSVTTTGTLPAPDYSVSAAGSSHHDDDADESNVGDHDEATHQLDDSGASEIAARYADNPVPRTPDVAAQNASDTTKPTLYDSMDIALPVTTAPGPPNVGQLVTSISTSGSVGGATAAGVDADYLAVSVDQQKSPVSRPCLMAVVQSINCRILYGRHAANIYTYYYCY